MITMPKWKATAEEKAQEAKNKKIKLLKSDFGAIIGKLKVAYNMTQNEIAESVNIPQSTFSRRLKDPLKFTVKELLELSTRYGDIQDDMKKYMELLVS